jgi:hypothetical protein
VHNRKARVRKGDIMKNEIRAIVAQFWQMRSKGGGGGLVFQWRGPVGGGRKRV